MNKTARTELKIPHFPVIQAAATCIWNLAGEVSFSVATSGNYRITIVTNADSYKENFLYLDENSAGTLRTSGNKWEAFTQTVYLTAGEHKYGVSADWGYTRT